MTIKLAVLGTAVAAVAVGAAVPMGTTPFKPGETCIAQVQSSDGAAPVFTLLIQGSSDGGITYPTLATVTNQNRTLEIPVRDFMRYNMTGYTSGAPNINLLAAP